MKFDIYEEVSHKGMTTSISPDQIDVDIITKDIMRADPKSLTGYAVFQIGYKKWNDYINAEIEMKFPSPKIKSIGLKKVVQLASYNKYSPRMELMDFPIPIKYDNSNPYTTAKAQVHNIRGGRSKTTFLVKFEFSSEYPFFLEFIVNVRVPTT